MAQFEQAFNTIIKHEGGYANVSGDRGGETYRGISRRWHPAWAGWPIIDAIKALRPIKWNEVIRDPQLELHVRSFYRSWWNGLLGDRIQSQPVATLFFDFSIMAGGAVRLMQQTLVRLGQRQVAVDNKMGPQTLAAINAVDAATLHDAYKVARRQYHAADIAKNPEQAKFQTNWFARIASFPDLLEAKKKNSV